MSFTLMLLIIYAILFITDIFAFLYGIKNKNWALFIILTAVIISSIGILGYLWITSPM